MPMREERYVINEADKYLPVPLIPIQRQIQRLMPGKYRRLSRIIPTTSGFIFSPYADDRMFGWRQYNTERSIEEAIAPEAPAVRDYVWKPVVQPIFKKGGKLVKAQSGLNTSLLDKNILDGGFSNR